MTEPLGGDPFAEGQNANGHKIPRKSCPYPEDGNEREEWLEGWDSAAAMAGDEPED